MDFKGTIFHTWKANCACRIYVADGQIYFIRRAAGIPPGTAAVIGSQFGLLGGLAVGLAGAAKAKRADLVRDDDGTPPEQLLSKHADNYAVPVSDILDSRIEPKGKYMSYGPNAGRWHFTRQGDTKETVVLLESPADASRAVSVLGGALGSGLRNDSGVAGSTGSDLMTDVPLPPDHADVVKAMQGLTQILGEQAPTAWQKVHCQVRAASPNSPKALEIVIGNDEQLDQQHPTEDLTIYWAAMRLAQKLSPSVRSFPGLVIEMTRLDQGKWRNNVKLMDKQ